MSNKEISHQEPAKQKEACYTACSEVAVGKETLMHLFLLLLPNLQ